MSSSVISISSLMTWLPSSSLASDIELFVVRLSLTLALFCLTPVVIFMTIDISLFLVKICVQSSSDTYATIKRQLSDPNLRRTFAIASMSPFSSSTDLPALANTGYLNTIPVSATESAAISKTPAPPSLFTLSDARVSFNKASISIPNRVPNSRAILEQLRNYIFHESATIQASPPILLNSFQNQFPKPKAAPSNISHTDSPLSKPYDIGDGLESEEFLWFEAVASKPRSG